MPVIYHAPYCTAPVPVWYRTGMKEDWHVKVDGEIAQAVRAYAKANGIALAAAVSILLKRGLETSRG